MTPRQQSLLVANGALVFLLGMLAGFPFAVVALGQVPGPFPGDLRAWRMAHLEGILNGLTLFAVAAIAPRVALGERAGRWLFWTLLVTAWGNQIASLIGPTIGGRGLEITGGMANDTMYVLFLVAVFAILVAMILIVVGATRAARARRE
jgi:hypothetical protein